MPAAAPQNVAVVNQTSTSLFITWDAVSSNRRNGKILGYKVHYTFRLNDGRTTNEVSVAMAGLNLTSLGKHQKYAISVLAFNDCGDGPSSDVLHVKTDEDSKFCYIIFVMIPALIGLSIV